MRRKLGLALLLFTLTSTAVFLAFPNLDLVVARWMVSANGRFPLPIAWLVTTVGPLPRIWVGLCIGFFVLAAIARYLGRPLGSLGWWQALYVLAVFAVGPGLITNALLKEHVGRPRPRDVVEFGGKLTYSPPFAAGGACAYNCAFVSGDAASAFAFVGPALLLPARRRQIGIAGALLFGTVIGIIRMYQGGHFLSDVVFAGLISCVTVLALHWAMVREDGAPRLPARWA